MAAGAPVALLAGGGALPGLLRAALLRRDKAVRVLALRGFAERALARQADVVVDILDYKRIFAQLEAWAPAEVVLVGTVHRPKPTAFAGALAAFRNRDEIAAILGAGDDGLLAGVIRLLEERGLTVGGIDRLAPELLAGAGVLGAVAPDEPGLAAAATGQGVLEALSPFDVGQAVVVAAQRVVAIEGPEGTDAMLARARRLRRSPRLRAIHGGVMVKMAKVGQDLRVDLPTIGPRTIACAARAGLAGIAIGAGATLIVDGPGTIAEADRRGLFLLGIERRHDRIET